MRYLLRLSMLLLVPLLCFFIAGCEKEELVLDRVEETADVVWGFTYPGIEVIQDDVYGNYLQFNSIGEVKKFTSSLIEHIDEDDLSSWISQYDFPSALNGDSDNILNVLPPHIAVILNESGLVSINGQLQFTDFETGKVYSGSVEKGELLFDPNETVSLEKSSCSYGGRTNVTAIDNNTYCGTYRTPTYYADVELKVTRYWYSSGTFVAVRVDQYSQSCPSRGPRRARGDIRVNWSLSYDDNGIIRNKNGSEFKGNDNSHTFYVFERFPSLCFYNVNVGVNASWSNGNIFAGLRL